MILHLIEGAQKGSALTFGADSLLVEKQSEILALLLSPFVFRDDVAHGRDLTWYAIRRDDWSLDARPHALAAHRSVDYRSYETALGGIPKGASAVVGHILRRRLAGS